MHTTTNIHSATSLTVATGHKLENSGTHITKVNIRTEDNSYVEITLFHDAPLPITTIKED